VRHFITQVSAGVWKHLGCDYRYIFRRAVILPLPRSRHLACRAQQLAQQRLLRDLASSRAWAEGVRLKETMRRASCKPAAPSALRLALPSRNRLSQRRGYAAAASRPTRTRTLPAACTGAPAAPRSGGAPHRTLLAYLCLPAAAAGCGPASAWRLTSRYIFCLKAL